MAIHPQQSLQMHILCFLESYPLLITTRAIAHRNEQCCPLLLVVSREELSTTSEAIFFSLNASFIAHTVICISNVPSQWQDTYLLFGAGDRQCGSRHVVCNNEVTLTISKSSFLSAWNSVLMMVTSEVTPGMPASRWEQRIP